MTEYLFKSAAQKKMYRFEKGDHDTIILIIGHQDCNETITNTLQILLVLRQVVHKG